MEATTWDDAKNKHTNYGWMKHLVVKASVCPGELGCFADREIESGELIGLYMGDVVWKGEVAGGCKPCQAYLDKNENVDTKLNWEHTMTMRNQAGYVEVRRPSPVPRAIGADGKLLAGVEPVPLWCGMHYCQDPSFYLDGRGKEQLTVENALAKVNVRVDEDGLCYAIKRIRNGDELYMNYKGCSDIAEKEDRKPAAKKPGRRGDRGGRKRKHEDHEGSDGGGDGGDDKARKKKAGRMTRTSKKAGRKVPEGATRAREKRVTFPIAGGRSPSRRSSGSASRRSSGSVSAADRASVSGSSSRRSSGSSTFKPDESSAESSDEIVVLEEDDLESADEVEESRAWKKARKAKKPKGSKKKKKKKAVGGQEEALVDAIRKVMAVNPGLVRSVMENAEGAASSSGSEESGSD